MRLWLHVLIVLIVIAATSEFARAATDLAAMQPADIEALQKRLADDGCYQGPIDGQTSSAIDDAIKACPDQDPVLRIETGMHTAQISRIGVDADCRQLVTASDDKTVRLWAMPEGRLMQTIRLPISDGNGGKVYAVAMSPDGRTIAAGGWDAAYDKGKRNGLYLVDLPSGRVRRIGAFEDIINHIAVSADGSRAAVALDSTGIRVIEVATGRELLADRGYGGSSEGVSFAADGSLYATSLDGFLRRYGADLTLAAKVKAPDGARPFKIAADPKARRVAVGYADTARVSILDAQTLNLVARAQNDDLKVGDQSSVAWTSDGRQILAGGIGQLNFDGTWRRFVRRLSSAGLRSGDTPVSDDTVQDLRACGSDIAFAAGDPSFGLVGSDGRARTLQGPTTADMRDKVGGAFAVSTDATSVRFGLGFGAERPVLFDFSTSTFVDEPNLPGGLRPAEVTGLPVTDWRNTTDPKLNGKPIALERYETSHALAVRPDRAGFVLGSDWSLRSFDAQGHERWKQPLPGAAWGVDFAAEGRIVVVANGDGTIRWHRWSDGQDLLALFVNAKDRRWVAWTPTGYYMASPGAEDMIGWHVNRGWEQQADFFPASRFRDKFNRPDIVQTVLRTLDEGEAVKQANATAGRRDDEKPLIERLPPVITILSPSDGSSVGPGMVEIRYRTRTPSVGTVDRVEAFVDGAKIEARGLGLPAPGGTPIGAADVVTLPMPAHDVAISLVAYADGRASDAARIQLKGKAPRGSGTADVDDTLKPTLYALLIGVTHYQSKSYDLAYPAQDAIGLAEALQAQKGRLYKDVVIKVLTDGEATTTAVKRGLSWLRKQTTAHDLAIVFAAGHGTTDAKGKFWFLTYDMDPDDISATAVSREDISDVLFDLPGKKLLFLDACHSGAALNVGARGETDISAAISDFSQTEGGVVAYAASTGREFSFEREDWGHGAFTKALIEGFSGKADLLHKGTITTGLLDVFLENRVKELTDGRQHPVMTRPKTVPDFPIATVN